MILYIGEDNPISATGLVNSSTGAYLTGSASVTYSLRSFDSVSPTTGTVVASGTMAYTAASDGDFTAVIESSDATLTERTVYWLWITLDDTVTANGLRRIRCVAQYREAN
jgi:hypothetical protein